MARNRITRPTAHDRRPLTTEARRSQAEEVRALVFVTLVLFVLALFTNQTISETELLSK
ncbi:hypothetical protein GCM10009619_22630 [Williamsia maris]